MSQEKDYVKLLNSSAGLLMVVSVLLAAYIGFKVFFIKDERSVNTLLATETLVNRESLETIVLPEDKAFDLYKKTFLQRDLFSSDQTIKPSGDLLDQDSPILNANWVKDYQLVGILIDKDSKAIVKDIKKNETLFMSQGDKIGQAVLTEIQEGKVVFSYNGQRVEMIP